MEIKIKICGLTSEEAVRTAIKLRINMLGFSFCQNSPRNISPQRATELIYNSSNSMEKVAVFANSSFKHIEDSLHYFKADYIQLDGDEPIESIVNLRNKFNIKLIKTIEIENAESFKNADIYSPHVDYLLFDGVKGHNHIDVPESKFNWGLLKKMEIKKPWILAGGLDRFNVLQAIRSSNATLISASPTLEESPGIKSSKLIEEFVRVIHTPYYL